MVEVRVVYVEASLDVKDCSTSANSSICLMPCLATIGFVLPTVTDTLQVNMNV